MIRSFKGQLAEDLFFDRRSAISRRISEPLRAAARRKLQFLNAAETLADLRSPPGSRLEALRGSLSGYHSIRVNKQWRIVFRWDEGALEVRVVDYH